MSNMDFHPIRTISKIRVGGVYIAVAVANDTKVVTPFYCTKVDAEFIWGDEIDVASRRYCIYEGKCFNLDVSQQASTTSLIFEYSNTALYQLKAFSVEVYNEWFNKNVKFLPTWETVKGHFTIHSAIAQSVKEIEDQYPFHYLIKRTFDERYEIIMGHVFDKCMSSKFKWGNLVDTLAFDETDELSEFQHSVVSEIAGEVLNNIENGIQSVILEYYNDRSLPNDTANNLKRKMNR